MSGLTGYAYLQSASAATNCFSYAVGVEGYWIEIQPYLNVPGWSYGDYRGNHSGELWDIATHGEHPNTPGHASKGSTAPWIDPYEGKWEYGPVYVTDEYPIKQYKGEETDTKEWHRK